MRLGWKVVKQDSWIDRGELSIGVIKGTEMYIHFKMPIINGKPISDTILIIGRTASGKSVVMRLIAWGCSKVRPVWILDYAGRDHYLGFNPNKSKSDRLPSGIKPEGLKGDYLYYPYPGSRDKKNWERTVRPNITKYSTGQLIRLGFSPAAARYLKNIFEMYGPFQSMQTLYEFLEGFPINELYLKSANKKDRKHKKEYTSVMSGQSKGPLIDTFFTVMKTGVYRTDNRDEVDYERLYLSKRNAVWSFNSIFVGKAEIDYIFEQLVNLRNKYEDGPRPLVAIEEAHAVFDERISNFITICRKLSVALILACPKLPDEMPKDVLGDIKNVICGKLKGASFKEIYELIRHERVMMVPGLKANVYTGEREMLYYNGHYDQVYGPLTMFSCPQEYHSEI